MHLVDVWKVSAAEHMICNEKQNPLALEPQSRFDTRVKKPLQNVLNFAKIVANFVHPRFLAIPHLP